MLIITFLFDNYNILIHFNIIFANLNGYIIIKINLERKNELFFSASKVQ
jgi:hypothetical protein